MAEKLISVDEVAELLNCPRSWVYERTRCGKIPCYNLGRYVRFNPKEIEEWIKREQIKEG